MVVINFVFGFGLNNYWLFLWLMFEKSGGRQTIVERRLRMGDVGEGKMFI